MKIINENGKIENFDAWSGAEATKQAIIDAGKCDEFNQLVGELWPDGLTETTLNDYLWFDSEDIYESLGIEEEKTEEDNEE